MLPKKRSMYGRSSGEWAGPASRKHPTNSTSAWRTSSARLAFALSSLIHCQVAKASSGNLADGKAAEFTVPNPRQREPARPVRLECCLDRADHVVARVLPVQAQVVAENRTAVDVDHHQQPDSLDLELLLEAERITDDDLQPNVEAVPIELDDFKGFSRGRRTLVSRHPLDVLGTGKVGRPIEIAQALGTHRGSERPDPHSLGIERVVAARQQRICDTDSGTPGAAV